jgi:hypothetical protein
MRVGAASFGATRGSFGSPRGWQPPSPQASAADLRTKFTRRLHLTQMYSTRRWPGISQLAWQLLSSEQLMSSPPDRQQIVRVDQQQVLAARGPSTLETRGALRIYSTGE